MLTDVWSKSFDVIATIIVFTKAGDLRAVSKRIFVSYRAFNLDFVTHAMLPSCISSYLRLYHRAILGYSTAFYPMFLILMTWICIKLHDRNFMKSDSVYVVETIS